MCSAKTKIPFDLYSLDFLSGSKHFKVFNREKNVSLVGLLFTLILAIIITIYSSFKLVAYFQKLNFSLISMEDNSQKVNALKYIGNETLILLRFANYEYNESGNLKEKSFPDFLKIFKAKVEQYDYEYENGGFKTKTYSMENCTKYITDDYLEKYSLDKHYLEQSLCPPYDKGLKLRWNKDGTSKLTFKLYLCNNNDDPNCYTEEEINEKYYSGELSLMTYGFIQEYSIIDNTNYNYPLSVDSYLSEKYIYLNGQDNCGSYCKYIHYESNDGIVFTETKYYSGLRYGKYSCGLKERKNIFEYESPIVIIDYSFDLSYLLKYIRTYEKITTVIVNITGIARILFFIVGNCISLLSENYFSYILFDEIFSQKYNSKNKKDITKNIKKYNDLNSQIPLKKNIEENKIKIYNIFKDKNKLVSENINFKMQMKNREIQKRKNIKNNIANISTNSNIITNEDNRDNKYDQVINKDNKVNNIIDDEKYSIILSKYLGYDLEQHKKSFAFWYFICSLFYKRNNKMKIIDSCAKMINNYLSLEKMINNGIYIDILLANCKSQEFNDIDILNKIIDDDFKKNIKNIKEKKGQ